MEDLEEMKLVEKLQEDLFKRKMVSEDLRRLVELKEEPKQQRVIQEAQIKKTEDLEMRLKQQHDESLANQAALEKKQDETNAGIADILKMLKNQSLNPSCTPVFACC